MGDIFLTNRSQHKNALELIKKDTPIETKRVSRIVLRKTEKNFSFEWNILIESWSPRNDVTSLSIIDKSEGVEGRRGRALQKCTRMDEKIGGYRVVPLSRAFAITIS